MDRSEEAPQNFVTDRVRNRPETLQEELTTGRYATNRTPRCIVVYLEVKREEANVAIRFAAFAPAPGMCEVPIAGTQETSASGRATVSREGGPSFGPANDQGASFWSGLDLRT